MCVPLPRSRAQRRADTERRLAQDVDLWVATAGADGAPYLVPLSFAWMDGAIVVSTPSSSPTGRNLASTGAARLGLGPTRDVTMIDGTVEVLPLDALPTDQADHFATTSGFDPRRETSDYSWFLIRPTRIQSWREANELRGRDLMRDGEWLE
jgi:hypothetical protein